MLKRPAWYLCGEDAVEDARRLLPREATREGDIDIGISKEMTDIPRPAGGAHRTTEARLRRREGAGAAAPPRPTGSRRRDHFSRLAGGVSEPHTHRHPGEGRDPSPLPNLRTR